jgi:hypothetical protein
MYIEPKSQEALHSVRSAMFIEPRSHEVLHSVRSAMFIDQRATRRRTPSGVLWL